jgi:hypothetical protein
MVRFHSPHLEFSDGSWLADNYTEIGIQESSWVCEFDALTGAVY